MAVGRVKVSSAYLSGKAVMEQAKGPQKHHSIVGTPRGAED